MQDRWAVIHDDGEWVRDEYGKVITFLSEAQAREHCNALHLADPQAACTTEQFTVEDALEELANSPFSSEGGL